MIRAIDGSREIKRSSLPSNFYLRGLKKEKRKQSPALKVLSKTEKGSTNILSESYKEKEMSSNLIRRDIAEKVAWATFNGDQHELGLMIENHYKRKYILSFEERELICTVWADLEEERLILEKEEKKAKDVALSKTKKTVPKKKKKSGITEEDE